MLVRTRFFGGVVTAEADPSGFSRRNGKRFARRDNATHGQVPGSQRVAAPIIQTYGLLYVDNLLPLKAAAYSPTPISVRRRARTGRKRRRHAEVR